MKKYTLLCLVFSVLFLFLSACTNEMPDNNPETENDTSVSDDVTDDMEVSFEDLYADVMNDYRDYIGNFKKGESDLKDGYTGIYECLNGGCSRDSIGYVIMDVNNDLKPELIIGSADDKIIFSVYALEGSAPVLVKEGWARNSLYYIGAGEFYCEGSGGAFNSSVTVFSMNKDGSDFAVEKAMFTDYDHEKEEMAYYSSEHEGFNPENAQPCTEEEFNSFKDEYGRKTIQLELKPFVIQSLGSAEAEPECAVVKAEIADDFVQGDNRVFDADSTEESVFIELTTDKTVSNLKVLSVSAGASDDGLEYVTDEIHCFGNLEPDLPAFIRMTFFGDLPSYGISYSDTDGTTKTYTVEMSGNDGSVYLNDISAA